jgi:glycosyltransferase involved in cell wall biosynthesis
MRILIANNLPIPALKYGGTERVIWWLGKELASRGHRITYLVPSGSSCPFAEVLPFDPSLPLSKQIPEYIDVVHSNFPIDGEMTKPYLITMHGYITKGATFDRNTLFVSKRHAELHHATAFVYNGLDPDEYGTFDAGSSRSSLLFLAAIDRIEKNLSGAIRIAKKARQKLEIIGGSKFALSRSIRYHGMIGGVEKNNVLRGISALLFPVTWDEPFGLALIESLYHGCPVIGTPYGSLPEIIMKDVGVLSDSMQELVAAARDHSQFNRTTCHDYVMTYFTSVHMTDHYLKLYEKVLAGEKLNNSDPYFTAESFKDRLPIFE